MGLNYLSNQYWLPDPNDNDWMMQQSLELPQDAELDLDIDFDNLVWFQDDFTLADTSIDSLFFNSSQPQTCHFNQQQQCCYSNNNNKRQKTQYEAVQVQPCTNSTTQLVNQTNYEAVFPLVFANGGTACNNNNNNSSYKCGRGGGGGGLSAQSIAARQRRRKIADKTHELGKLIPGGHTMNTAEMFHSASMYVKFLQAQISILNLTNNSLQICVGHEEQVHFKQLAESPMVQEKLYTQEKCLVPYKLIKSLSMDSELKSDHPFVIQ